MAAICLSIEDRLLLKGLLLVHEASINVYISQGKVRLMNKLVQ